MNIILGGALTNNQVYDIYNEYIIETYQNIDMQSNEHYKDLTELIYNKHFKDKSYDLVIGHSMGGLIILDILCRNLEIKCKKIVIVESYIFEPSKEFRNIVYKNIHLEQKLNNVMRNEVEKYNSKIFDSLRKLNIVEDLKDISRTLLFVYGMRDLDNDTFLQKLDFPNLQNVRLIGIPQTSHFCLIEKPTEFLKKILNDD
ncbi:MAG TPA: alpha/beta hydrolase [Bacillota bacterium]|nr:alpha/beta hydrolase [Bacillota bacterium]HPF42609.1 alpha/beta hydrolase [Bacillota bacterium]HPQ62276.1 alpha/beta hydrolase [Bacillota bacterium]